ncbi:MAG: hypothetical protein IBX40_12750 [Methanosarcinales archaeon]|nr:hypothetical protein [Methanosarcinales archaeon]
MGNKPLRRNDLDWIRILATFVVIIFHTMRMFDPDDWEVNDHIHGSGRRFFVQRQFS